MLFRFLLPDGEISDGVRRLLPDEPISLFSEALAADDLSPVEFYVPPYLGGRQMIEILPRLTGLRVIQLVTAGIDWIAPHVPAGVLLCRGVGVHERSVAELVLADILAMTKGLPGFHGLQADREWAHRRVGGLAGKRAVVLGQGAIGTMVAELLTAFEVHVVGVSRSGREPTRPLSALAGLLPTCDILVVLLPLTDETHGLVDEAMLAALPDGALVVNVSRGSVVHATALERELVSGRLHAALDVTDPEPLPRESPLWALPNVLITPHTSGLRPDHWAAATDLFAENIRRFDAREPLLNVVDKIQGY